jgi:hypothetical protein
LNTWKARVDGERIEFYTPTQAPLLLLVVPALLACLGAGVGNFAAHPHRPNALGALSVSIAASIVLTIILIRTLRSGTLIASHGGVLVRSLARTRRWAWSDIGSFEEVERRIGAASYRRHVLLIHLADGQTYLCTELNESSNRAPSAIASLAKRLNDMQESVSRISGAQTPH